ncbi:MAG: DUF499 domain-containing protein [Sandaracinaceae bacterium]|nr:DUF499 domain-containing protein [Sandaracinaceae bacterium]
MLGLTLREEFQGRRLKGTAIELANDNNTGATQVSAAQFLGITYPTADVVAAMDAIGPNHGQPVVLIGERGQGKSHLLAALYHAFTSPTETSAWLAAWGGRLSQPKLGEIKLRPKTYVISESLHRQNFKFLWDLVFDSHPHGNYVRGKWEAQGDKRTDIPGDNLLLELFKHTPTALILDEFQTWYEGLRNTDQFPWRTWAFNFIQLLSEIAKEHPELLVLVVSVRNGETDAYQQIHRVNPRQIDFKGPNARRDRLRLLLHRLFDNRRQTSGDAIEKAIATHVAEHLRLADVAPAEHDRVRQEFVEAWPFAPHLMTLLEDQVLVATQAQETRDLIRILADIFKSRGDTSPVLTAADFRLDDDKSGIAALLDSISNQHHASLREKAQRNLSAVVDAVKDPEQSIPHLAEIVGALWLRSLAVKGAGAEPSEIQVDITREEAIDDNAFQAELSTIVENSFNIHQEGARLVFREEENPQAKLIANARNDKLFADGSDSVQLAREVRYVIGGGESVAKAFKVIVLGGNWTTDPWDGVDESDRPAQWDDRIPILILPEPTTKLEAKLGTWLKDHLQNRRNTVRFLIPREGSENLFYERDLAVLARAVLLADKWKTQNPEFKKLHAKYERELRDILKRRFDRFAILANWNFQNPTLCKFHIESHKAEGAQIPETVDSFVIKNLFVSEDFDERIHAAAQQNESVGKLLRELQEPRPGGDDCIPWLGETLMKEKLVKVCARGEIAINLRGMDLMQLRAGEDEDVAWKRMRGKLGTGRHLDETTIQPLQAAPHVEGVGDAPRVVVGTQAITVGAQFPVGSALTGDGVQVSAPAGETNVSPGTSRSANNIFGERGSVRQLSSAGATSALNLLGKVENWGITTGTQIQDVQLKVANLTGAQLSELLKKLPDGITYELTLNKEE